MSTKPRAARPQKEAFFVQVKTPEDKYVFFDTTDKLGKEMPYDRPEATCALRVTDSAALFTLLKLSNRARQSVVGERLTFPLAPLARMERRGAALAADVDAATLVVELDETVHKLAFKRDENGVVTLEAEDDVTIELPKTPLRLMFVLRAARGERIISAGFIGHLNKPGATETLVRVAAMALNYLAQLPVFRLVSGIETVHVPASPSRWLAVRPARKPADEVTAQVPVRLWSDATPPENLASAVIGVKIDLETANPASGRLLFHFSVPAELEELFKGYHAQAEDAVSRTITSALSVDEVSDLVYEIALGELNDGGVQRLRDALAHVQGLDMTPRQWALFAAQPTA